MNTRELDEARRGTDVLVDRIAVLVSRDHAPARHVWHRCRQLLERYREQLADQLLRRTPGEHVRERRELRRVIDGQPHRVGSRGARCGRALAPAVEQILEAHQNVHPLSGARAPAACILGKFRGVR